MQTCCCYTVIFSSNQNVFSHSMPAGTHNLCSKTMVHLHIKVADKREKVITLIVPVMECQVTQSFDCEDHGLLWTTDYADH